VLFRSGLLAVASITAGGADLGDFFIAGAQLDIRIEFVPAPGTAVLAAMGGLVATRRRRG